MQMKNSQILITNDTKLINSHITNQLIEKNVAEIIIVDNFVHRRRENLAVACSKRPITIIEGDIGDRKLLAEIMENVDIVFHQAAIRITQCAEEPRLALEVLVDGTFNVLEAAVKAGVKRVVAASSASVYGMAEEFPTTERHHSYNNRTLYGAAKVFNEGLLRSFYEMYGLNYVALRYFNVYGSRMDIHGVYTEVLIRWMDRIAAGLPPLIFGDGKQTMDFISVEDVARANILAAESAVSDEVFNIASGVETSLNELLDGLLKVMGSSLIPEHVQERKVNPVPRRLADTRRAEQLIGFRAQIPLLEGLKTLVSWWTQQNAAQRVQTIQ